MICIGKILLRKGEVARKNLKNNSHLRKTKKEVKVCGNNNSRYVGKKESNLGLYSHRHHDPYQPYLL